MRFEHLVEINDLERPAILVIDRERLWRGLVLRAERPELFVPTLSEATILARTENGLVRVCRFGELAVTDEVSFVPLERVRYDIAPQGDIPRSSLTVTIEEPRPRALFVRFVYEDARTPAEDAENAPYDDVRRAAYEAADIDTIGLIRRLVEEGQLDVVEA